MYTAVGKGLYLEDPFQLLCPNSSHEYRTKYLEHNLFTLRTENSMRITALGDTVQVWIKVLLQCCTKHDYTELMFVCITSFLLLIAFTLILFRLLIGSGQTTAL